MFGFSSFKVTAFNKFMFDSLPEAITCRVNNLT